MIVSTVIKKNVREIGPNTAVKRIKEWWSLDRASAEVRKQLPDHLEAIRAFFREPPVLEPGDLAPRPVDAAGVQRFLCAERDFAAARVQSVLDRLRAGRPSTRRLEDFA